MAASLSLSVESALSLVYAPGAPGEPGNLRFGVPGRSLSIPVQGTNKNVRVLEFTPPAGEVHTTKTVSINPTTGAITWPSGWTSDVLTGEHRVSLPDASSPNNFTYFQACAFVLEALPPTPEELELGPPNRNSAVDVTIADGALTLFGARLSVANAGESHVAQSCGFQRLSGDIDTITIDFFVASGCRLTAILVAP